MSQPDRVFNVLFLCTRNSARSILAEAVLNKLGGGQFRAFSAGSQPGDAPLPDVLDLLQRSGHDTSSLYSKSWDAFAGPDAPALDFVFTLCDSAAGESCPVWPGQPMTAHWPFDDPARATGTSAERRAALAEIFRQIHTRLSIFINLPLASLDRMSLQHRLDELGQEPAATPETPA